MSETKVIIKREITFLLKTLRRDVGMSQRELAKQIGCSFTHISKLENGVEKMSETLYLKAKKLLVSEYKKIYKAEPLKV